MNLSLGSRLNRDLVHEVHFALDAFASEALSV